MIYKLLNFCKSHKILSVFIVVLIAIIVHGMIWIVYVQILYVPHLKGYEQRNIFSFTKRTDEYTYLVKVPGYPQFTGNLCVTARDGSDLLIWLNAFDDDIYWLTLKGKDGNIYSIYTDSKCKPFSGNPAESKAIEENQELVDKLFNEANKEWELKE